MEHVTLILDARQQAILRRRLEMLHDHLEVEHLRKRTPETRAAWFEAAELLDLLDSAEAHMTELAERATPSVGPTGEDGEILRRLGIQW